MVLAPAARVAAVNEESHSEAEERGSSVAETALEEALVMWNPAAQARGQGGLARAVQRVADRLRMRQRRLAGGSVEVEQSGGVYLARQQLGGGLAEAV